MMNKHQLRLTNLRRVIKEVGSMKVLAEKAGYSNSSFISQLAGPKPKRVISEQVARALEESLELAPGYLDEEHAETFDRRVLSTDEALPLVAEALEEQGIRLPMAALMRLMYILTTYPVDGEEEAAIYVRDLLDWARMLGEPEAKSLPSFEKKPLALHWAETPDGRVAIK
jgi:hypothetical protein